MIDTETDEELLHRYHYIKAVVASRKEAVGRLKPGLGRRCVLESGCTHQFALLWVETKIEQRGLNITTGRLSNETLADIKRDTAELAKIKY